MDGQYGSGSCYGMPAPTIPTPPGLEAIYSTLRKLYPDQPNPLQVTALVKCWLGGPDPLDFISMFGNPGSPMEGIPPHWHYVSSGLSDLHGDGRVHKYTGMDGPSGYGFELTFRLKKQPGETAPPAWPAELLQQLARYVFQTENMLYPVDHISWHAPLDYTPSRVGRYTHGPNTSQIQHMLLCEDPQIKPINTQLGRVEFIQVIGIMAEELQAAQHWHCKAILDILHKVPPAGGPWLVTDMDRVESVFEIQPHLQESVSLGIEKEGSSLSGVAAKCWWEAYAPDRSFPRPSSENPNFGRNISPQGTKDLGTRFKVLPAIGGGGGSKFKVDSHGRLKDSSYDRESSCASAVSEIVRTRTLCGVHLRFGYEAAMLLTLAIRGRLRHGRHFTFTSSTSDTAITFVTTNITGSIADREHQYAACGTWLQILISEEFLHRLDRDLDELTRPHELDLPKEYRWPGDGLIITVLPDEN
ncbi:suppressor of fused homolog [Actinia tenebrosa]|uniref:Suppressor of fused homolog n=1 Tax=Actinia tenebrosa TaxID=6105 RepID=A0A6P8J0U6_ACTTE|nr:suppressor of fused homolog [Actinia tenebrosa]